MTLIDDEQWISEQAERKALDAIRGAAPYWYQSDRMCSASFAAATGPSSSCSEASASTSSG